MTEYDCWKMFPKATAEDIGLRNGFRHEGTFFSTEAQKTGLEGLICIEDTLVQIDEMGIEHGWDVDRVL